LDWAEIAKSIKATDWIAAAVAAVAAAVMYLRQWSDSFDRIMGWLTVACGLASISVAALLTDSPWRRAGPLTAGCVGLVVTVLGVLRLRRAPRFPADNDVHLLVRVIRERSRDALADPVPLTADVAGGRRKRGVVLLEAIRRTDAPMLYLLGGSGSGKTTALRAFEQQTAVRSHRARRPRHLTVYVDLATAGAAGAPASADGVRGWIAASLPDDPGVREALERQFADLSGRLRWVFLFDAIDDLVTSDDGDAAREQARGYLDAIERFLSTGPLGCRAVVAVRDRGLVEFKAVPTCTVRDLSRRQQRQIVGRHVLSHARRLRVLTRLTEAAELLPVATNPLLLTMLARHLQRSGADLIPSTPHAVVESAIAAELRQLVDPASAARMLDLAEDAAAQSVGLLRAGTRAAVASTPGQAVQPPGPLVDAGVLLVAGNGRSRFTHQVVANLFAARWLVRRHDEVHVRAVVADGACQDVVMAALPFASAALADGLVTAAADIVRDRAEPLLSPPLDISDCLATRPDQDLPAGRVGFSWPIEVYAPLRVLAEAALLRGPESVGQDARATVDRLVVHAFAAGAQFDQLRALRVSAAASPPVAVWATERAARMSAAVMRRQVAVEADRDPRRYAALSVAVRVRVVLTAGGFALAHGVWRWGTAIGETPSLSSTMVGLARLVRVVALLGILDALVSAPDAVASALGLTLSVLALHWSRFTPTRVPAVVHFFTVLFVAGIGPLVALTRGTQALVGFAAEPSMKSVAGLVIVLWLATWPACMAARLLLDPVPARRIDRWLPQLEAVRLLANLARSTGYIGRMLIKVRVVAPAVAMIAAATVLAVYVAPLVFGGTAAETVRVYAVITVLAMAMTAWLLADVLRYHLQRRRAVTALLGGATDGADVLDWLARTKSFPATLRIFEALRDADERTLAANRDALLDLGRCLEWVWRAVPAETTKAIPRAIWDLGPELDSHRFRPWLDDYDRRFPGRLWKIAASQRGAVTEALARIQAVAANRLAPPTPTAATT
jgi:hypothetical protein